MSTVGMPGVHTGRYAQHRKVLETIDGRIRAPWNVVMEGAYTRDTEQDEGYTHLIAPGTILKQKPGAYTTWENAILGTVSTAASSSDTTLHVTTQTGVELNRRDSGFSGTYTLVGPATADGTMHQETLTITACSAGTGDYELTVSAISNDYIVGSLIMIGDWTTAGQFPLCVVPDGFDIEVLEPHTQENRDREVPGALIGGVSAYANLRNILETDTSLIDWLLTELNAYGQWVMKEDFVG